MKAEDDIWTRDKRDHYEYIATYVDDILIWSKDPMKLMHILMKDFQVNGVKMPRY